MNHNNMVGVWFLVTGEVEKKWYCVSCWRWRCAYTLPRHQDSVILYDPVHKQAQLPGTVQFVLAQAGYFPDCCLLQTCASPQGLNLSRHPPRPRHVRPAPAARAGVYNTAASRSRARVSAGHRDAAATLGGF